MIRLAVLVLVGGVATLAYSRFKKSSSRNAAFGPDQPHDKEMNVRDAGPRAMRDKPQREWTEVDEDLDESFPASDPPGGY